MREEHLGRDPEVEAKALGAVTADIHQVVLGQEDYLNFVAPHFTFYVTICRLCSSDRR